jgi:trehalose 6-phosphate phosphatase
MKNVLLPRHGKVLGRLAGARTLLAFDFDGTLAPIVRGPHEAMMRAATSALFERACELFPTAVISGRGRGDVTARLGGAQARYVLGNHGMEGDGETIATKSLLNEARVRLHSLVNERPGLELEDKGYSLAVHFRRAKQPRSAQHAIRRVLATLAHPLRTIGGKCVINVLPEGARDKGDALLELCKEARAEVALYVGDDVTDEDVFELRQPARVISVRVGRSSTSAADYYVDRQRDIDVLLRRLIALRTAP